MPVDPRVLAASRDTPLHEVRRNLETTVRQYSDLGVFGELLQNSLDAIDLRRYRTVCEILNCDSHKPETIQRWNSAVTNRLESDYDEYRNAQTTSERAKLYRSWHNNVARRDAWWSATADAFGIDRSPFLAEIGRLRFTPSLTIVVDRRSAATCWIEIIDSGTGINSILDAFTHGFSTKWEDHGRIRRMGIRGSHGLGLTAVLAMSDAVQVVSRMAGQSPRGYEFARFASFARGSSHEPQIEALDLTDAHYASVFHNQLLGQQESGTHVRFRVDSLDERSLLGNTLTYFSDVKFANLLRLHTPIGQVYDSLLHPAYHCIRKGDMAITLIVREPERDTARSIEFDTFRIEDVAGICCLSFDRFVYSAAPKAASVQTVHRAKLGNFVYLSSADIQAPRLLRTTEKVLRDCNGLPAHRNADGVQVAFIPRGFHVAFSGMRSAVLAREPHGVTSMFRGVVLAEVDHARLTRACGIPDSAAVWAARHHEREYETIRAHVAVRKQRTQRST